MTEKVTRMKQTANRRPAAHGKSDTPAKPKAAPHTPRTHKPENLSLEAWQIALRREFGREQDFLLENLGPEPFFSEFLVTNPQSGGRYRVAIRGRNPGDNFCSCPDFSVNTLGTCKHVEFTLAKLERRRGARTAFRRGYRPPYSEIYLRYGSRREVAFSPGEGCPEALRRLAGGYFDERGILRPEAFARFETLARKAGGNGHEVRVYEDALQFVAQVRDEAARRAMLDGAFPRGSDSDAFESLLKEQLYAYQREGALFAARAGRSLIADDMGLGKTVQALAAVEILARHAGAERALVVCPTSLKHQWAEEIGRFTGRSAEVVQGGRAARSACFGSDTFYKITNYDVICRDAEAIARWSPDVIILDEAQRIKNWRTRTAQSVKRLASPFAVVLTGTPLENRLEELHSIVEFVDRFRLGPSFRFLAEHQQADEVGKVVGYRNLSRISQTLEPILLRRSKGAVLQQLPERMEKRFFVEMTPEQMGIHEENRDIVARIVKKWRRQKFLTETDQRRLRIALQTMRMSCNSTYLVDHQTDSGRKADEAIAHLEEIFERPEAKAVVFSQWVRTHEILLRRIAGRAWGHVFFHGGVPGPQRKDLIRRFRQDPDCRVFLSTDAGGVGLNLQAAEAVLNMDLPWNPAVLEQRIGRVHRLGQHRPVRVVHFVAEGTIEHGMINLLNFKKSLFAGVLEGGQDEVFLGGDRLQRFMEAVEETSGAIPEPPPHDEEVSEGAEEIADDAATEGRSEAAFEAPETAAPAAVAPPEAAPARESGSGGMPAPSPAAPPAPPWSDLVTTGLSFLEKLGQAMMAQAAAPAGPPGASPATGGGPVLVERDEASGRTYLRLPVPDPGTLERLAGLFAALAKGVPNRD